MDTDATGTDSAPPQETLPEKKNREAAPVTSMSAKKPLSVTEGTEWSHQTTLYTSCPSQLQFEELRTKQVITSSTDQLCAFEKQTATGKRSVIQGSKCKQ
jgi:hypothetical protein